MLFKYIVACPLITFILIYGTANGHRLPRHSPSWTHSLKLGSEGEFRVEWKSYNDRDGIKWLEMKLSAPTKGYVGIGFTKHGGMDGADIAIGWVTTNGHAFLKDFHGEGNGEPMMDPEPFQSYQLIKGEENESGTVIHFRRRWDTCDDDFDIAITNDTMRMIWAYGADDPVNEMTTGRPLFSQHSWTHRGVRSVFMQDKGVLSPFPDDPLLGHPEDAKYWDFTMNNNTIDAEETTYFCKIVRIPDTKHKVQMIGMRPLLVPENKDLVHHIGLYECVVPKELGGTDAVFREHLQHPGGRCFTATMPPEWAKYCHTFLITWAAGSEGDMFPQHIGNPIGEEHNGATYFMMEMHYNNPARRTFVDSSGVRVFYTDKPRSYDSSTMLIGHRFSPFQLVPPGQPSFKNYGLCSSECTTKTFPSGGINVVSVLLHGHLAARTIRLRHFRKGIELPLISQDERYDYNYQQTRFFPQEVNVLPGDELVTECDYNTSDRSEFTLGGLTAKDEMCLSIILYYPRIELDDCRSQPELNSFFAPLAVENVEGKILSAMRLPYNPTKWSEEDQKIEPLDDSFGLENEEVDGEGEHNFFSKLKISAPLQLANLSVMEHISKFNWNSADFAMSVQEGWKDGQHYAFCTGHGRRRIHLQDFVTSMPRISPEPVLSPETSLRRRKCSGSNSLPFNHSSPVLLTQTNDSNFQRRYPGGTYEIPETEINNAKSNTPINGLFHGASLIFMLLIYHSIC